MVVFKNTSTRLGVLVATCRRGGTGPVGGVEALRFLSCVHNSGKDPGIEYAIQPVIWL